MGQFETVEKLKLISETKLLIFKHNVDVVLRPSLELRIGSSLLGKERVV